MDWFQIGKGICQACILLPCLFKLYAEYIMQNARLDDAQVGIKVARRNINNLRYADDTTLLGARVRHSALGKGHEEGGSAYAKVGLSLRSPPRNPRASTLITRACLLYYFVLYPTPLTLWGAIPHHLFRRRS